MYKDKIVTLDNGLEYLIMNEFDFNNRKFVMGAMVDTQKDLIDDENLLIKEIVNKDGVDSIVSIDDPNVLDLVSKFILNKEAMGL